MKQTAVDFLSEKYMYVTWLRNRDEISAEQADKMRLNYLLEAKQIEKEQTKNAYWLGTINYNSENVDEQYYTETYENK
jgi:hypothetical protein